MSARCKEEQWAEVFLEYEEFSEDMSSAEEQMLYAFLKCSQFFERWLDVYYSEHLA